MMNHSNRNSSNQESCDMNQSIMFMGGGGGATRSWGITVSGQSLSTSGSVGSPSSRSEAAMATAATDGALGLMSCHDSQGDDARSQGTAGNRKKKRGQRAVGGDKSGRGLRQFSMKVCEKVESKGRTTYNEVADELVAEFADSNDSLASPDQKLYDEKNIRRRVYDALNVLMAMDIISKDKKEIQWKGLPRTTLNDIEELKAERLTLQNRIDKKAAYLEELREHHIGLRNLIRRNKQIYRSGNAPTGGVSFPFIMIQTRPHATVELEISEDMQLVHFDFNSTPFELHDDYYVLKAMNFCKDTQSDSKNNYIPSDGGEMSIVNIPAPQSQVAPRYLSNPNKFGMPLASPPLPGIIKSRVKYEH
ncbi:transcription factor-like protein DPB [Andrographis paniculata]|uniref:transcription factor-like protein DPB n=1 Tax=Andrographis paniculata TaxID=175694 RepID=UPI0021E9AA0A|nr:transcription factor-like protein DPB [Andrographis paniculata]